MGVREYKPTSAGRRFMSVSTFEEITKKRPEKSLLAPVRKTGGRNNKGRITTRHIGGGHKRNTGSSISGETSLKSPVRSWASSMTRTARPISPSSLTLTARKDIYSRRPGVHAGHTLVASKKSDTEIKEGNTLPLKLIPLGTFVHNVEMKPGKGGQMARSAGSYAQVVAKEGDYGHLRFPSGEVKLIHLTCTATIGQVGNIDHENVDWGKAGRSSWRGVRPTVRGTAMNPVDHPLGGGEGRTKGGGIPARRGDSFPRASRRGRTRGPISLS